MNSAEINPAPMELNPIFAVTEDDMEKVMKQHEEFKKSLLPKKK